MKKMLFGSILIAAGSLTGMQAQQTMISELSGECRNGQVFLQWQEKNLPADARLSVWSSAKPLTRENLKNGSRIASLLNPRSARDWWLDIDSFLVPRSQKARSEEIFAGNTATENDRRKPVPGFVIREGGKPLDPNSGLHVHTPNPSQAGPRYFAVTAHHGFSDEIIGFTATEKPLQVSCGKIQPIRLKGKKLARNCAAGLPLLVSLHGRGGGAGVDRKGNARGTHLLFVPAGLAWREGIPFKFEISVRKDHVLLSLFDRVWIGRRMGPDEYTDARDCVPAISTFWMGYSPDIAVSVKGPKYRFDNFTERYILFVIRWIQEYLGTDPMRTCITGGSMGGSGAVQLATHFPEVFSAVSAHVPVYSYTWVTPEKGPASAWRLTCSTGKFTADNPARMPDGRDVLDYGNGAKNIARSAIDMPPLFSVNGRNDLSIPWQNNPPFFAAASRAKQFISIFWNNGNHSMSSATPKDMKNDLQRLFRFRLNESFPVFSNCSDDRNYGNGDPKDGDLTGWINRGIGWSGINENSGRYEISVSISHPEIKYPVKADVTIRRRQYFRPAPGSVISWQYGRKEGKIKVGSDGLVTVPGVVFESSAPVKLILTR